MPSSRSLDFKDVQQWSHAASKTPKACLNLELLSGSDRIATAFRRQVKNVISFYILSLFVSFINLFGWGHLAIPGAMLADGMEEDLGH